MKRRYILYVVVNHFCDYSVEEYDEPDYTQPIKDEDIIGCKQYEVPPTTGFKSFMSYTAITSASSDQFKLQYTQYVVMMVMWEKEEVSSRDLADCTHLDYGTLTPVLKRLEQAGYLTRQRMPEDERLLLLTLTKEGKALKDKAVRIPPCIASCMGLTMEEFKTLYEITYKALRNMENDHREANG